MLLFSREESAAPTTQMAYAQTGNPQFSDVSDEAWFSIFIEEAVTLLGCSADELAEMKAHLQELHRRKKLEALNDGRQQNVMDQLSLIHHKQSSGTQYPLLNNDILVRDASQMFIRNILELLHNVDKEYSHGTQSGYTDLAPITEAPKAEPDNAFTPSHDNSSRSQCFGLKLASPSQNVTPRLSKGIISG
ncbi:hypothetical protein L6452_44156 [Arctium lappa]|uniref:Uncharacterized protein n=1 Tax=Arctium lappa TaxID=4217 RepID=A0ACB8XGQ3_ARCLA|nr:hypothetical protein L6452_44156 [Arctium lappa]